MGDPGLTSKELWTPSKGYLEVAPGLTIGSVHHTEPICRVFGYLHPVVANACRIVAVPDMEDAMEATVINYDALVQQTGWQPWCAELQDSIDGLRAALDKARGK